MDFIGPQVRFLRKVRARTEVQLGANRIAMMLEARGTGNMTTCVLTPEKIVQYGDLSGLLLEEVVIDSPDSKARHGKKGLFYCVP